MPITSTGLLNLRVCCPTKLPATLKRSHGPDRRIVSLHCICR